MQKTLAGGGLLVLLLLPSVVFGAEPQVLDLSAKAQVGGASIPLDATISTENTDVVLSTTDKAGATAVTFTLYLVPKPKPATTTSGAAAVIESSSGIQQGIAGVSPQAASVTAPAFVLVDGGRSAVADVLDAQIENTKKALGPGAGQPGEVLGADDVQQASSNPMGAFWYIVQTLYLYILTILRFLVGSAGVFYPLLALLFFFILWKVIRRFRRPAY